MSTNAIISIRDYDAAELYKHWDGYPEATLAWLEKFNREFVENRGDDPEYKLAQLIRSSVYMAEEFRLDDSKYTGWGVFIGRSVSYDYLYILEPDGTVTVDEAV